MGNKTCLGYTCKKVLKVSRYQILRVKKLVEFDFNSIFFLRSFISICSLPSPTISMDIKQSM